MVIVATDAPVNERQLKRLAKRAAIGLGRTGTSIHNGSGDIIIAFSNGYTIPHSSDTEAHSYKLLRDDHPIMNKLFQAVVDSCSCSCSFSLCKTSYKSSVPEISANSTLVLYAALTSK